MMPIEMMISEVRIVQLRHMKRSQHSIEFTRFMHHFMSNGKLRCIQVRNNEDTAYYVRNGLQSYLSCRENMQVFEENCPRQHHSRIEGHSKVRILSFKLNSFLVGRVSGIQAENLIQDGKTGIGDRNKNIGVGMIADQPDERYECEQVIGPRVLQKTVFPEDVQSFSRQPLLQPVDNLSHTRYFYYRIELLQQHMLSLPLKNAREAQHFDNCKTMVGVVLIMASAVIILQLNLFEIEEMIASTENPKALGNTNCSVLDDTNDHLHAERGKKRIGRYSFYPKNLVGSGYSSKVFRAVRDNFKGEWLAIKVIKIASMRPAHLQLLHNQLDIIKQLDHSNILKFIDVQFTHNHCYLVTQFCEGGNLEHYAKKHANLNWGKIIYQVSQGLQYLAQHSIVHRDLKPANIFLKDGVWKIGDFGFSKRINNNTQIVEDYKIGSPLFMPLESLEKSTYSSKNDSFALGVSIYYLIARKYPWMGNDPSELVNNYREKSIDWTPFQYLPLEITAIVKGLLNHNPRERLQLSSCNFDIFLAQKSINQINSQLQSIKITEQVVICQFIHYLAINCALFLDKEHPLCPLICLTLTHLTTIFKWDQNQCLKEMKKEYALSPDVAVNDQLYRRILHSLQSQINLLKFRNDSRIHQVALQKLLQYYSICKHILSAETQQLLLLLPSLTLHKSYKDLQPSPQKICALLSVLQAQ